MYLEMNFNEKEYQYSFDKTNYRLNASYGVEEKISQALSDYYNGNYIISYWGNISEDNETQQLIKIINKLRDEYENNK